MTNKIMKTIKVNRFRRKPISVANAACTSNDPYLKGYSTFAPNNFAKTKGVAAMDSTCKPLEV